MVHDCTAHRSERERERERESRYGVYIYVFIYVLRNIYRQDSGEEIVIYILPHVARDGTEEYAAPSSAYVRW